MMAATLVFMLPNSLASATSVEVEEEPPFGAKLGGAGVVTEF